MVITSAYAALLALFFIFLSAVVIRHRRRARQGVGDGGDAALERAIRVHGNFAEYAPLTLLLIGMAEMNHAPHWLVNVMALALLAGRVGHAVGLSRSSGSSAPRTVGAILTFAALIAASIANLILVVI